MSGRPAAPPPRRGAHQAARAARPRSYERAAAVRVPVWVRPPQAPRLLPPPLLRERSTSLHPPPRPPPPLPRRIPAPSMPGRARPLATVASHANEPPASPVGAGAHRPLEPPLTPPPPRTGPSAPTRYQPATLARRVSPFPQMHVPCPPARARTRPSSMPKQTPPLLGRLPGLPPPCGAAAPMQPPKP